MKELASSQLVAEARKSLQAQSTRDQYDRYQEKFMEWCDVSGYKDDYNVTKGKVTRYFACLTCETEDPQNGIIRIKPLPRDRKGNNSKDKSGERRANMDDPCSDDDVDGGDVEDKSDDDCEGDASRDVDIHNSNNDNSEERWYSTATILLHLAAIGDLYKHQCEDRNNLAMDYGTVPAPKTYLQPLIDVYRVRMSARKRSTDTDFGSIDFTQNPTSIVRQLMKRFWMRNVEGAASLRKRRLKGLRDRADISTISIATMG
ncbi:hypothetical protein KI688_007481 [Linnemannia hyalina]|uniref:Uncharacterized protein n=1 Tax=Linnemannia hyalina TaxID=64524 RepID=A0A9P7XIJ6_9FUNG|nr:hypothetical protein KI688_007481 [Linnemannia hyalina]